MRLNIALIWLPISLLLRLQDAQALLFDVFELPAVDRPTEHRQDGQHQQNRYGNQDVENFHCVKHELRRVSAR